MPCPFPGMDPYLEDAAYWASFQHQFVAGMYQILLPGLVDRYRAKIGTRNYVTELTLFTSILREPHAEEFIEIRDRADGRLVTVIDFPSPSNRTTTAGRASYLETRKDTDTQRANAIEIDLVTQGLPLLDYSRDGLPEYDYAVSVSRASAPGRYEIYTTTVQKRLPKFKVPLAHDDRDALLDLQDVFRRAYDLGSFAKTVDYRAALPMDVKISVPNRDWIEAVLRQQKLR